MVLDTIGTEIKVGDIVVYNLSGDLACGTVEVVKPSGLDKYDKPIIKIRYQAGAYALAHGHMSTVRNPKGIMVMFTPIKDTLDYD